MTERDPATMSEEEAAAYAAKDRETWEELARHIIASERVLDLFADELGKLIAGERDNAKLLYLIATSRLFPKTMHAALKGTSSGGKSILRTEVLKFFPPEDVVSFTSLTEKAHVPTLQPIGSHPGLMGPIYSKGTAP